MTVCPKVVSLWEDSEGSNSLLCSGWLIGRREILTVKHAVPEDGKVFVGLLDNINGRREALLKYQHSNLDAALLYLDAELDDLPVVPSILSEHRSLTGTSVSLYTVSPIGSPDQQCLSNYSIGNYDGSSKSWVLSPQNAKGHSGGVVTVGNMVVGLLWARTKNDPLCLAISMHVLWPWLNNYVSQYLTPASCPDDDAVFRQPLTVQAGELGLAFGAKEQRIARLASEADVLSALGSCSPIINIFGPSGRGKSKLLYMLRERLRSSGQFVDCLFPPLPPHPDDSTTAEIISKRIGGHVTKHSTAGNYSLAWDIVDRYHREGRRVVFMLDDLHEISHTSALSILKLLEQYDGTMVIATTRTSMKQDFREIAHKITCIELPFFNSNEIAEYFVANAPELSDAKRKELLAALAHPIPPPILLRNICLRLHREPDAQVELLVKQAWASLCDDVRTELEAIFEDSNFGSRILYELSAPKWLDSKRLFDLLRLHGHEIGESECRQQLEELTRRGVLKRFDGRYWWEGQYRDCTREGKSPSIATWRHLNEMATAGIYDFSGLVEALSYLRKCNYSENTSTDRTLRALEVYATGNLCTASLPKEPIFEEALKAVDDRLSPLARRLAAQYFEARGNYDAALKYCERWEAESPTADILPQRFQSLEKSGRFNEVAKIIVGIAEDRGLSSTPATEWGATLLFYWGRYHQGAGSLGHALNAYRLIGNLDDPDPVLQIHALIESGTVYVFAEEPKLAIEHAQRAVILSREQRQFARQEADALRYLARAAKLAAVKGPVDERQGWMDKASQFASESGKLAKSIGYMEGQLWAKVLEGRLAYFNQDWERARVAFESATDQAQRYVGAIPHIARHQALLMATTGNVDAALSLLDGAMRLSMQSGRGYMQGLILHTRAKVCQLLGLNSDVHELLTKAEIAYRKAEVLQPPFSQLQQDISRAHVDPKLLIGDGIPW